MRGRLALLFVIAMSSAAHADDDDVPDAIPSVMDRRFAVSIAQGASTLQSSDVAPVLLGVEVAAWFRARPELELGGSLAGGVTPKSGWAGLFANLRYRLMPERPWTPYLLASLGEGTVIPRWGDSTGAHLAVRAGVGIERRFESWGFAAELQGIWIDGAATDEYLDADGMMEPDTVSGMSLLVGAVYYIGRTHPRNCEREWRTGGCIR